MKFVKSDDEVLTCNFYKPSGEVKILLSGSLKPPKTQGLTMRTLRIISYIIAPIATVILFAYLACFGGEGCSGIPFWLALSVFYVVSLVVAVIILFTQSVLIPKNKYFLSPTELWAFYCLYPFLCLI